MTNGASRGWALVLGASSGFGEATSIALARAGWNIAGVHLDRKTTLPNVDRILGEIRGAGRRAEFWNMNAADDDRRAEVVARLGEICAEAPERERITVLMHSLAFGTLKPFIGAAREDSMAKAQMEMTFDVMAHSLVYWVQDVCFAGLLSPGAHVFAMTSAGDHIVWPSYGAVSAAKCALEAHVRQLAVELGGRNVAVNCLRAGVTDTPALRKIPGNEAMIARVLAAHPRGRLTTPSELAATVVALASSESTWVTGNIIGVDGGEDVAGGR